MWRMCCSTGEATNCTLATEGQWTLSLWVRRVAVGADGVPDPTCAAHQVGRPGPSWPSSTTLAGHMKAASNVLGFRPFCRREDSTERMLEFAALLDPKSKPTAVRRLVEPTFKLRWVGVICMGPVPLSGCRAALPIPASPPTYAKPQDLSSCGLALCFASTLLIPASACLQCAPESHSWWH